MIEIFKAFKKCLFSVQCYSLAQEEVECQLSFVFVS